MKTQTEIHEDELSAETTDKYSEKTRDYLLANGVSKADAIRYSFSVEEIMLGSTGGKKAKLTLQKKFGRLVIELKIDGEARNAYVSDKAEDGVLSDSLLRSLGLSPEYAFTGGFNTYTFRIKKKSMNPMVKMLITIAIAIGVGLLGTLIPNEIRAELLDGILSPVHSAFLRMLSSISGPMIFLSVAWGIYGIGDAATLKRVGQKLLGGYIGTVFLCALAMVATIPFFRLSFTAGGIKISDFKTLFAMFLDIIPPNIIEPFSQGNTLQIIFFAVVIGIAMLFLGKKTTAVARAVEQINNIVQFLIEFISKLVPYFIGIIIVIMIWRGDNFATAGIGKMIAIMVGSSVVITTAILLITAAVNKMSPLKILKSVLPIGLVGITTSSSAACYGSVVKCAQKDFGVDNNLASFGVPLGIVAHKPFGAISFVIMMLFFAEYYEMDVSFSWVVLLVVTSAILALACVPIPGGSLSVYIVLLSQLGINPDAIAIALACDTIMDLTSTACDQMTMPMVLLNRAHRLGMVKTPRPKASSR